MSDDKDKPQLTQHSNSNATLGGSLAPVGMGRFSAPGDIKDELEQLKAKLTIAQQSSPQMKKAADGVLSGIGSRSGNPRDDLRNDLNQADEQSTRALDGAPALADAEKAKPASSNDTFVGRYLTTLGNAFLTVPPSVAVAIALKSENPNWYVVSTVVASCWLVGGFLIAAGQKWPKWKPNHEVLAKGIATVSNSILAWSAILLLFVVAPTVAVNLLVAPVVRTSGSTQQRTTIGSQPYPQMFGTTCTYNLINAASQFWSRAPKGTAVLITGSHENEQLKHNLSATFQIGGMQIRKSDPAFGQVIMDGPNNAVDMDAPHLKPSEQNGIILHGGDPDDTLKRYWENSFVVRRTSKLPDGLAEYYKVPSIVWIEVGPGNPWLPLFACSAAG